ncbi:diguanylate cyclase [uncultured Sphingomonas sp.]|uniref:GGDEF domain-containing protein n=1 Tax=uncultured Sphingomonas sp. TaxID=158754 RepID=UPI0025D1595D|nr:diguanylate cyclase [uncultured Sphingomonas sp.]
MSNAAFLRALGLLLAFVGIWSAAPVRAQAGVAGTPLATCIGRVQPGDTVAAMLRAPGRFDCSTPQTNFGGGDYWALSAPLARKGLSEQQYVRVISMVQRALTLSVLYADGRIATIPTTSATLSRHIQLGAIAQFALPQHSAPPVRLLWRIEGSANLRGILTGQRIAGTQDVVRANLTMAAIYAAFGGLVLALLLYNLALWWALRFRFQLAYCLMVALLFGYASSSSGLLAWMIPGIDNNDRIRMNMLLLSATAAAAVGFARCFFEERIFAGWLGRYVTLSIALLVSSGIVFVVGSHLDVRTSDRATTVMMLVGLAVTAPILWRAWRRGSRYLAIFAVAWSLPILSAMARLMAAMHLIPDNFWLNNSTILTMAFEAMVSSLAIAYRVQALGVERDAAMAAELRARALADTDPLTGLLNRRAFLERAIGRPERVTLLLVDIDHFKLVNDTLGHDGGDDVLRVFARTLHAAAPNTALIARIGGEEFAIIVPADSRLEPDMVLDALRDARMPFDLRVTASIGCCTGTLESEARWKALYRIADKALFDAKKAGRDRARIAPALSVAA